MKNRLPQLLLGATSSVLLTSLALGHGTISDPVSRIRSIYLEGPDSPDSASARAALALAGANQYYTWNQVSQNIPNYADPIFDTSYASVIPDGKLASGNNVGPTGLNFSGLDLVSNDWDWPATPMTVGPYTLNWLATATHDPSFFKVWITKEDFNHKTPLAWDDMEFLGKIDHTQYTKEGSNQKTRSPFPNARAATSSMLPGSGSTLSAKSSSPPPTSFLATTPAPRTPNPSSPSPMPP